MAKVALVLSGCGYLDGSEIHETVLCLLSLAKAGHQYHCFAPDKEQIKVVNHLSRKEIKMEKRNALIEAARVARGEVAPLESLQEKDFAAILMPGGMGAILTLCNFAEKGIECTVDPLLKTVLLKFYQAKKPIGATCISPLVVAQALRGVASVEMTLGTDEHYRDILNQMGMKGKLAKVNECISDAKHLVYTTPCYMEQRDLVGMHQGIEMLVQHMFLR